MIGAVLGDIVGSSYEIENLRTKHIELFTQNSRFTDETVILYAYYLTITRPTFKSDDLETLQLFFKSKLVPYFNRISGANLYNWTSSGTLYRYSTNGYSLLFPIIAFSYASITSPELSLTFKDFQKLNEILFYTQDCKVPFEEIINLISNLYGCCSDDSKALIVKFINTHDLKYKSLLDFISIDLSDLSFDSIFNIALISVCYADSFTNAIQNAISAGGKSDTISCLTGYLASLVFGVPVEMIDSVKDRFHKFDQEIIDLLLQTQKN